jgi:uncharacterized protein YdeI (YjbR/CyaY-like superfamily)
MNILSFKHNQDLLSWFEHHHESDDGIWIKFDKTKTSSTLTSYEALEAALCYGWIDGQIKKIDETYYIKYFKKRSNKSIWSTQNKKYAEKLIKEKKMKPSGFKQIELAKQDGRWEKSDKPPVDYDIDEFMSLLKTHEKAYQTYMSFSPSIKKTYALSYYTLKKPESRSRRLKVIIERLESGLKPM